MSNNITKTIKESLVKRKCSCIYECNCESHLLQSQIRLLETVEMELRQSVLKLAKHKECHEGNCEPCENCMSVLVLSDFVSNQISSLNETLEFLKKSL